MVNGTRAAAFIETVERVELVCLFCLSGKSNGELMRQQLSLVDQPSEMTLLTLILRRQYQPAQKISFWPTIRDNRQFEMEQRDEFYRWLSLWRR